AVGFQPLDTLTTWRRGQAHQTADLGDRVGGILLQQRENLAVDGVHRGQTPCKGNKCNLDGGGRMISSLPRVFEVYRENYSPATEIDTLMASPLQLAASKASTSARRGAAMLPPRRVHLSPAAAAANRSAATTSRPSASASANAPWNTSPAPSVSIASTAKTGLWRNVAPSRQSTSPRALGDGEKRWGRLGNGGERGAEVVEAGGGAQTLAGEHHVRGDAEQLVGHLRRPVGVEHHGEAACARRHADRPHEFGKAVIGEHRVGACHQARRVGGRRGGEPIIVMGHDHAIAARVDEDGGDRGRHAGKALAAGAVDL